MAENNRRNIECLLLVVFQFESLLAQHPDNLHQHTHIMSVCTCKFSGCADARGQERVPRERENDLRMVAEYQLRGHAYIIFAGMSQR